MICYLATSSDKLMVLSENGPGRLIYTWSPVGGTAWEGLGGMALEEEMLLGHGFEVSKDSFHYQHPAHITM